MARTRTFISLSALLLIGLTACQTQETVQTPPPPAPTLPGDEASLLKQGDTARALGKNDEAIKYYQAAAERSTSGVRAHLELANYYRKSGKPADAAIILKKAYALDSRHVEVLNQLAQSLLESGQGQEAGRYLARGLSESPKDVRLMNGYGVWLDQMGQHDDAQANYRKALTLAKTQDETYITSNNLALSLIAVRKPQEAISLLEKLPAKRKDSAAVRQMLALAYGVKGDKEKAFELAREDLTAEEARQNLDFYERFRTGKLKGDALFRTANAR